MEIKRMVANIARPDPSAVDDSYHRILGLDPSPRWALHGAQNGPMVRVDNLFARYEEDANAFAPERMAPLHTAED